MNDWSRQIFATLVAAAISGTGNFPAGAQGVQVEKSVHLHASSKQLKIDPHRVRTTPPPNPNESANADPPKSWSSTSRPAGSELSFLKGLSWQSQTIGAGYTLRTGIIYGQWIAAWQFFKNGKLVLTEYTPVQEYVTVVDPNTGTPASQGQWAKDVNNDGVLEIAFKHEKLHDPNYHMYTIYGLEDKGPKLLWKSGGRIGDWRSQAK